MTFATRLRATTKQGFTLYAAVRALELTSGVRVLARDSFAPFSCHESCGGPGSVRHTNPSRSNREAS